jgi:hypothetical protein
VQVFLLVYLSLGNFLFYRWDIKNDLKEMIIFIFLNKNEMNPEKVRPVSIGRNLILENY